MNWKVRFLRNALFGILPVVLQEKLRSSRQQDHSINPLILREGLTQADLLSQAGYGLKGKTLLDIGTGWQPVIPIIFHLAGCRVTTIDSQVLMQDEAIEATATSMIPFRDELAAGLGLSANEVERTLAGPITIKYLAPYDILKNDFPGESFDIITSHAVLEHVPPETIRDMLVQFKRILKPKGMMCHMIDNSDHWEHRDKSISRLNFLTLNDAVFSMLCAMNPLDYQNRLRHYQYREMFVEAGFEVVQEISTPNERAMEDLKTLELTALFQGIAPEDLAVLTSYFVSAPASRPTCGVSNG